MELDALCVKLVLVCHEQQLKFFEEQERDGHDVHMLRLAVENMFESKLQLIDEQGQGSAKIQFLKSVCTPSCRTMS